MVDVVKLFFFCRMFAINQPGSGSNRWEKQNDQKERNISCFIFWHFYGKTCDPLNYIYILRWLAQPRGLTKWKWKRTHELVSFSIELGYFLEQGKFIKTKRIICSEHVKRINVFSHMMRTRIMINIVKKYILWWISFSHHLFIFSISSLCRLLYFIMIFFDARLSNSSTFRGWLESTGLDDILVCRVLRDLCWTHCFVFSRWTHVTASLDLMSFPQPPPGTLRRQQVAGQGRCRPSSPGPRSEQNGSLSHYLQIELDSN